jgi:peroxiredoxin
MFGGISELPPSPPCWPAYPEPERTRLRNEYFDLHKAYCERQAREFAINIAVFSGANLVLVGLSMWVIWQ